MNALELRTAIYNYLAIGRVPGIEEVHRVSPVPGESVKMYVHTSDTTPGNQRHFRVTVEEF